MYAILQPCTSIFELPHESCASSKDSASTYSKLTLVEHDSKALHSH